MDVIVFPSLVAAVANELEFTANGTSLSYSGTLGQAPVRGSISIAVGSTTVTDDSNGNLTGTGVTGTIDYGTGNYTLTFTSAPAAGVQALGSYQGFDAVPDKNQFEIAQVPIECNLRSTDTVNGTVIIVGSVDGISWFTFYDGPLAAGGNKSLGVLQYRFIKMYSSVQARFMGHRINSFS